MVKAKESSSMYVALLRGINVGGKNIVPMKDLAALFAATNCEDVRTFIQSGNVVFRATPSSAKLVPEMITTLIEERFGLRVPVVLRSSAEIDEVLAGNPYLQTGIDEKTLHIFFLAAMPSAADVSKLDPERSPGDEYLVVGREIFARAPNGMGRSKLTNAYFDSKLKTVSTARNWNTVGKLAEMMKCD